MKGFSTKGTNKYIVAQEGAKFLQKIKMKVDAEHDIMIAFSKTNPISKKSFEIVLGGGKGDWSAIRSGLLCNPVERENHSKEEFDQV